MSYQKIIAGFMTLGLLSACGTDTATVNQADALFSVLERGELKSLTEGETASLSGTATMKGYIGATANPDSGTVYLGDATASFDFDSRKIFGSASNFNEYQLAEACMDGFADCTGEKSQDLDGSMVISGTIDADEFQYYAVGALSGQDEKSGAFVAEVELFGGGVIGKVDDNLTAIGSGGGEVLIYGPGEGRFVGFELQSGIFLQE